MQKLLQLLRNNATQKPQPLQLVRNEAQNDATLYIYDVIDKWWGVSSQSVAQAIAGLDANTTLHLRINTPGGDVFEGRAIRTAIQQHKGPSIAHIDGLCASAGTTIADGADEVEITEGGFYMIHNGWTWMYGNKHDCRKTADLLDKIDAAIIADYAKRTGVDTEQLVQWMDAETWFTAQEAVEHGFANRIMALPDKSGASNLAGAPGAQQLANSAQPKLWDVSAFDNAPQALLQALQNSKTTPVPEPDPAIQAAMQSERNARRLRLLTTID